MSLEDRDILLVWLKQRIAKADEERSVFLKVVDLANRLGPPQFTRFMQEELDQAIRTAARAEMAYRVIDMHYNKDN
jgi:hypothetical protein